MWWSAVRRALGELSRHWTGTAAAGLTTILPCVVPVHRWMLWPVPSRCRRSRRHLSPSAVRVMRRLQAGAQIVNLWPDAVSQRFASRLALSKRVAQPVIWRRLAVIVAAPLCWLAPDRLLSVYRRRAAVSSLAWQTCSTWASGHGDRCVWSALAGTDAREAAQCPTRRWKADSDV